MFLLTCIHCFALLSSYSPCQMDTCNGEQKHHNERPML
ncbi:hypothetical protein GLYMA_01G146151v4 [Glycine max]|nr:hypothetical protein GLYMA_01G146151v4 [Glycine max]KAH1163109.1 hypothetical protein GYH30_001586 [Glycine max]